MRLSVRILLCFLALPPLYARETKVQRESLQCYIERMQQQNPDLKPGSVGSLWTDNGKLVGIGADYKAARVGDLITILVVQDVTAQNTGNVSTARSFSASSGITALPAGVSTSKVSDLFSPTSTQSLSGKTQAATSSTLRTSLAGRVVAILPSGVLVIEAERQITMNNERQTVLLRGLVRPRDVSPANTVPSNNIANLEFELKGKGVLSDGTRPPNFLMRMLLRLFGF